ncbi:MAG: FAD-dependent oxidoreductase [Anaerolineae bacterium]|nr:FAD-dependent oxidoreductase [Anaerolineae bacterium]
MSHIIILGAGLSGLMAAHRLTASGGHTVTVLDKGRSVGGRLATRRVGGGHADHGAQFFTVREPLFDAHVQRWLADGVAYEWSRGWSDGTAPAKTDGFPRYAVKGGLNALATYLQGTLPTESASVRVNVKATAIQPDGAGWCITDEAGATFIGDGLILTAPVPQSLALLDAGQTKLTPGDRAALEAVRYDPCLCGLILLDRPANLPEPGAVQRPDFWVTWLADNQRKGISAAPLLTLHANPAYSAEHYDAPDEPILADLEPVWRAYAPDAVVVEAQVKRWRYSHPSVMHPTPTLLAENLPPLAFAGDAFGDRSRIEGAVLSALAAADAVVG